MSEPAREPGTLEITVSSVYAKRRPEWLRLVTRDGDVVYDGPLPESVDSSTLLSGCQTWQDERPRRCTGSPLGRQQAMAPAEDLLGPWSFERVKTFQPRGGRRPYAPAVWRASGLRATEGP